LPRIVPTSPERTFGAGDRFLFVEGETDDALDAVALRMLLGPFDVKVRAAGGCDNVIAAAKAFARMGVVPGFGSAECYAVMDRDHRGDDETERTWAGGPFAERRTHLYWRRHEFENYLLEPEFLAQPGGFLRQGRTAEDIRNALLREARRRVFLDAANLVLKALREEWRWWDVREFGLGEADFSTVAAARDSLLTGRQYERMAPDRAAVLAPQALTERFDAGVALLLGGRGDGQLEFGAGQWLQRMEGSNLIGAVLHERFFQLRGSDGRDLTGPDLRVRVARDLMRRFDDLAYRPADLVAVRDHFRDTQPPRFPSTDTAGSPTSR